MKAILKTYHSDRLGRVTVPDADAEYYAMQDRLYEAKAAELVADGYERVATGDIYKWNYTRNGETLAIVRQPASAEWYATEVTE